MPRSIQATYVNSWTSIVGALTGALRALSGDWPIARVAVLSGHAFRLAITATADGAIGADGPTTFAASAALPLYEGLGWRFAAFEAAAGDPRFAERREEALKRIRKAIDRGRPAIVFGLHLPEFGVVRGYRGDALIAATTMSSQYGERVPVSQWPPPGRPAPLRVFVPDRAQKVEPQAALGRALRFAVTYAREGDGGGPTATAAAGLAAYTRWAETLETDAPVSPHGQAYCIQALQEARGEAAAFLRAQAVGAGKAGAALAVAATAYTAEVIALSQLATLFPYPNGGNVVAAGSRRIGAAGLRRALAAEEEALAALAAALRDW